MEKERQVEYARTRITQLGRGLALLAVYALVASVVTIAQAAPAMIDGEGHGYSRAAIAIVGIVAGLLVISGRRFGVDGWQLLVVWSLLQLPVVADEPDGYSFRQLFDIRLSATSSTRVNGVLTSYSELGVNALAIVLFGLTLRLRGDWVLSQRLRRESGGAA